MRELRHTCLRSRGGRRSGEAGVGRRRGLVVHDGDDVAAAGRELRWHPAFAPEGANVNFVQVASDGLHVRTFEKGVEGETLACGTGLTASAIAAWLQGFLPAAARSCRLRCRRGDWLSVDFVPDREQGTAMFSGVYLTGPAERL